jgi:hypothetical protein
MLPFKICITMHVYQSDVHVAVLRRIVASPPVWRCKGTKSAFCIIIRSKAGLSKRKAAAPACPASSGHWRFPNIGGVGDSTTPTAHLLLHHADVPVSLEAWVGRLSL